jgi:release factor glutamine methyltransferase
MATRAKETGSAGTTPGEAARVHEPASLVSSIAAQLDSRREATWIVQHASAGHAGEERLERVAHELADRRSTGEPLQYVLGRWPFRSLDLKVDRRVLIPRPETEEVVGVALAELRRARASSGPDDLAGHDPTAGASPGPVCVDLGTGAGGIALSLATEGGTVGPGLEVWATDRSSAALDVARDNLHNLGQSDPTAASRVRLVEGSWFDALPAELAGHVDLVVSNPPYVAESEYPDLDPVVRRWEPRAALVAARGAGGVGGMAAIEAVIAGAPRWLRRTGAIVVEIAPSQARPSIEAARRAGFSHMTTEQDLSGRPRMLVARC